MRVTIIINTRAGAGARRLAPAEAAARSQAALGAAGVDAAVWLTEGPGHARELARRAVETGADVVCAWGGDGTVNDVASALLGTRAALAVVPAGSGNGFARDLGIPLDIEAALDVVVRGETRVIDAGEVNGRPFVNVSGLGFDAHVAHRFAGRSVARGQWAYVRVAWGGIFGFRPPVVRIEADGCEIWNGPALAVAIANTRQWGSGALIAPAARPDDGRLDVVAVAPRSVPSLLLQAPRLWAGTIGRARGVVMRPFATLVIDASVDTPWHVDGEPAGFTRRVHARVRPACLRVKVPAQTV
jgi:YegS/Rv2252/BmrU family lipid kinase